MEKPKASNKLRLDIKNNQSNNTCATYQLRRSLFLPSAPSMPLNTPTRTIGTYTRAASVDDVPKRFQVDLGSKASNKLAYHKNKLMLNMKKGGWFDVLYKKKPHFTEQYVRILRNVARMQLGNRYELTKEQLGRGSTGTVYLVRRKFDNKNFAAKFYTKLNGGRRLDKKKVIMEIMQEVLILSKLHHENVISTVDVVSSGKQLLVVMEYCPTNLFTLIEQNLIHKELIDEYFCQLAAGVAYLHNECSVAHRDLKLENLCIGMDGKLKIIDFGCAVAFHPSMKWNEWPLEHGPFGTAHSEQRNLNTETRIHLVRGFLGSLPYIAPEVWHFLDSKDDDTGLWKLDYLVRNNELDTQGYDPCKCDIWSMGIVYLIMFLGEFPWASAKPEDADFATFRTYPKTTLKALDLPETKVNLLLSLLELNPNRRIESDELMLSLSYIL